jgi:hypothetical protein
MGPLVGVAGGILLAVIGTPHVMTGTLFFARPARGLALLRMLAIVNLVLDTITAAAGLSGSEWIIAGTWAVLAAVNASVVIVLGHAHVREWAKGADPSAA